MFYPSCFFLISPFCKYLEYLNTVPCNQFVNSNFIAFRLHHYLFATRQYVCLPPFHLSFVVVVLVVLSLGFCLFVFVGLIFVLFCFKRRKKGNMFFCQYHYAFTFFLTTCVKLIYFNNASQRKYVYLMTSFQYV